MFRSGRSGSLHRTRSSMPELPAFEFPPVNEIVIAVQFVPVPQFGIREAVAVARAFEGWEIVDVLPALEPIVEAPLGVATGHTLRFGLGTAPQRVVLSSEDGHQIAQVQQDRVAAHQRLDDERPSFSRVQALLRQVTARASGGLQNTLLEPPHQAELVEVIYDNIVRMGGGWRDPADLHRLVRIIDEVPGDEPYDRVEQVQVGFTYLLREGQQFLGRLRVMAEPYIAAGEQPGIRLQLISRRIVGDRAIDCVLEQSHADIVKAFTAVTTEEMHQQWRRIR